MSQPHNYYIMYLMQFLVLYKMSMNVPVMLLITALRQIMRFVEIQTVHMCVSARLVLVVNTVEVSSDNMIIVYYLVCLLVYLVVLMNVR